MVTGLKYHRLHWDERQYPRWRHIWLKKACRYPKKWKRLTFLRRSTSYTNAVDKNAKLEYVQYRTVHWVQSESFDNNPTPTLDMSIISARRVQANENFACLLATRCSTHRLGSTDTDCRRYWKLRGPNSNSRWQKTNSELPSLSVSEVE